MRKRFYLICYVDINCYYGNYSLISWNVSILNYTIFQIITKFRNNHKRTDSGFIFDNIAKKEKQPQDVVRKKCFLKSFASFTGRHLCCSLYNKVLLLKRDTNSGVFLWNLRNFYKHVFWTPSANGCFWHLTILLK